MLKIYIAIAILFSSPMVYAQTEQRCLLSGKTAEVVAQLMIDGASEESVIASMREANYNSKRPKLRQQIMDQSGAEVVGYVFTMRPTPAEARSTVYLKCMAGGLGHIDWSKYPEAIHAK